MTESIEPELLRVLDSELKRLENAGARHNRGKCRFIMLEVEYVGNKITKNRLMPTEGNICVIRDAPTPTNMTQLEPFLGMMKYYGKFRVERVIASLGMSA